MQRWCQVTRSAVKDGRRRRVTRFRWIFCGRWEIALIYSMTPETEINAVWVCRYGRMRMRRTSMPMRHGLSSSISKVRSLSNSCIAAQHRYLQVPYVSGNLSHLTLQSITFSYLFALVVVCLLHSKTPPATSLILSCSILVLESTIAFHITFI